jgi:hypothetical protein
MAYRTIGTSALLVIGILAIPGVAAAQSRNAAPASKGTVTIVLDGTLGPVISGSDPAGLDGDSATITLTVSESLKPYKLTSTSASYHISTKDIVLNVNGNQYSPSSRYTLVVNLGKSADTLTLSGKAKIDFVPVTVSDVTSLAAGSFSKTVRKHLTTFSPSPQNLSEPSSTFTYTALSQTTVLGVTGTAASSD